MIEHNVRNAMLMGLIPRKLTNREITRRACAEGCDWLSLTCAGVIVNADKSSVTDAHEGSERVHTLRVLVTVMPPLGTLVDICGNSRKSLNTRCPALN